MTSGKMETTKSEKKVSDQTIATFFEAQVLKTPNQTAVYCNERTLTYKELNKMADSFAFYLSTLSLPKQPLIGVMVERTEYLLPILIGIFKIGAAYLPIDSNLPQERIFYMLNDSKADLVVTESAYMELLSDMELTNPIIGLTKEHFQFSNELKVRCKVSSDDVAYVIYTSGSTGLPKGVAVTQYNIINLCFGMDQLSPFHEQDVFISLTIISFDISVLEMFWPLTRGITIVMHPSSEMSSIHFDGKVVLVPEQSFLRHSPITIMQTTPSRLKLLVNDKRSEKFLRSLRVIYIGGEPLQEALLKKLRNKTRARLYNMYGPTETTVWSTGCLIKEGQASSNIGRPLANVKVYVLDDQKQLVPNGEIGELYIGGSCISKGYLNRDQLTSERFLNDPFSCNTNSKMYRTGDLVRFNEMGELEFIGRQDYQLKIRGHRVEIGEIEAIISQYKGIRDNVVIDVEDVDGEKQLIAVLVWEDNREEIKQLREFMKRKLPEYMIPIKFHNTQYIPLTVNGKVERKQLKQLVTARTATMKTHDELERDMIEVWSKVLQQTNISIDADFFLIGGSMLLAIKIEIELERKGHMYATSSQLSGIILECKTIRNTVQFIVENGIGNEV